jgi:Zn-dependent peptidase ImmA (M78 family)
MNPTKRKEIGFLAETIREGLELRTPLDVEEAVIRLGGSLQERARLDGKMEALVQKAGERFEIILCAAKPDTRKRFSIAHELGHLFLHMGYLVNPDLWREAKDYHDSVYYRFGYGIEEAEANEFAAAFLMPEDEFQQAIENHTEKGRCAVQAVAEYFHTSKDAVMMRGRLLVIFRPE